MHFYNVSYIIFVISVFCCQIKCGHTQLTKSKFRNVKQRLFVSHRDLKLGRESTPRPLLADDVFFYRNYLSSISNLNIIDFSNFYFLSNQSSEHLTKSNIRKNYMTIVTENNEEIIKKQVFGSPQYRRKDESTLDKVWHMYMSGITHGNSGKKSDTESFDRDWILVKKHILPGSFMEIGGCHISSILAQKNKSNTALAILIQQDEKREKSIICSKKNIANLYVSESSPERIQTFIQDTYSGFKILFDNLFLKDYVSLRDKLLPHEYVKLLSRTFSLGKKIFIPGATLTENEERYMKANWDIPSVLFKEACQRGSLGCNVENLWGDDSWGNEDSIFCVTITRGQRILPRGVCHSLGGSGKCHANYTDTSSHLTIVHDNGSYLVSPIHTNELHINTLLSSGLSSESRRMLFVRLLQMQYAGLHIGDDLFVSKSEIITKFLSGHADANKSRKENPSKPNAYVNSPPTSIPNQKEQVNLKQNFVQNAEPVRKNNFRRKSQNSQLGGGWERELRERYETRKLEDGIRRMEREDNSVDGNDVNRQFLTGTNERRGMSEEETQIHQGLDYLQRKETEKRDDVILKSLENHFLNSSLNGTRGVQSRSDETYTEEITISTKSTTKQLLNRRKSVLNRQKLQLKMKNQSADNASYKTTDTVKFETVNPRNSKIILQKLLAESHRKRQLTYQNSENSANRRKLLSLPPASKQSEKDVLESYLHFTRERHRPASEKQKQIKEATQPISQEAVNDEIMFDAQWQALKPHIRSVGELGSSFSMFIYGTKRQSLLGSKISLLYPQANIINIFPEDQAYLEEQHRKLMKTQPKSNNLVFTTDFSPNLVRKLYAIPQMFKCQVLSLNVFESMIHLGDTFPYYLGQILALSETTFLELPHFGQLALAQTVFSSSSGEFPKGLITTALRLVGAQTESVELLRVEVGQELHSLILKIRLSSINRKVSVGCDQSLATLSLLPDSSMSLHLETANTHHTVSRTKVGFSLDLLNTLGLHPHDRASLFQEYLRLPVHADMCPAHIVWTNHELKYQPITEELTPPAPRTIGESSESQGGEELQKTFDILMKEIADESFSFMDYNSKDHIGYELANRYPNSTFVSLVSERSRVAALLQRIQNTNISNIVLNLVSLDSNIMNKLLKCPDFLRYQFMDYEEVLRQMQTQQRDKFDLLIGQMLATGVTSFLQVPSSKIISLAAATFFQDELQQIFELKTKVNNSYLFQGENHPLEMFKAIEDTFLLETAKADVDINVSARSISPPTLPDGAQLPWKLVRVDISKLKVQVDHHFDYAVDGHMRKYTLNCNNNNINGSTNNYTVFLVRGSDGFKIPYGNVNAISLIALLRMGLVKSMKEKFYTHFLQLPLYEDMAPWNIVFRAGRLEYIDYDSRDLTFNKMSAAAYQIMAMLMNYKRTIQDFGRCKSKAKTAYGFDIVAECVSSEFEGPCTDLHYPVPCGDHTCKATYIDCLRALQDMEEGKVIQTVSSTPTSRHGNTGMQWSFNLNGLSSRTSE